MAKTKTIKAAPKSRNADLTDATFRNPVQALIRFNSACVVFIEIDYEQNTASVQLTNDLTGVKMSGTADLTEVE